ncbi:MAG: hypothetical protein DHS80DRAFT_26348 [Piptocephalis tieghemiana]|nr:MAG: hypothetical protein DHS80DRAFT_26348 [Piptocephalis tieghemiana]
MDLKWSSPTLPLPLHMIFPSEDVEKDAIKDLRLHLPAPLLTVPAAMDIPPLSTITSLGIGRMSERRGCVRGRGHRHRSRRSLSKERACRHSHVSRSAPISPSPAFSPSSSSSLSPASSRLSFSIPVSITVSIPASASPVEVGHFCAPCPPTMDMDNNLDILRKEMSIPSMVHPTNAPALAPLSPGHFPAPWELAGLPSPPLSPLPLSTTMIQKACPLSAWSRPSP